MSAFIGPALPSHLRAPPPDDEDRTYGPALPPDYGTAPRCPVGPGLPSTAPTSPPDDGSDTDEEVVGPMPQPDMSRPAHRQLELRAIGLRQAMESEGAPSQGTESRRETWMLELPEERATALGLGPRQFRRHDRPDLGDRSAWTDTPADRKKKKTGSAEEGSKGDTDALVMREVQCRDEVMQHLSDQLSADRSARSLVDMHREAFGRKRKADGKELERRPFSRELDLQVFRLDGAQKKSIMDKARHLDDRFSSGRSKFL